MVKRLAVALAAIGLLVAAGSRKADAAFEERDILNEVNETVAVLRYLHQQMQDIEQKHDMVRDTRLLTETQQAAQQRLWEEAQEDLAEVQERLNRAEGDEEAIAALRDEMQKAQIRVEIFKIGVDKLTRQTEKLAEVDLEKTYAERLETLQALLRRYQVNLDAKLLEFRVHFGKAPPVDLDFKAEVSRFRRREMGVTYLTIR